jgi:hypothetical protein
MTHYSPPWLSVTPYRPFWRFFKEAALWLPLAVRQRRAIVYPLQERWLPPTSTRFTLPDEHW